MEWNTSRDFVIWVSIRNLSRRFLEATLHKHISSAMKKMARSTPSIPEPWVLRANSPMGISHSSMPSLLLIHEMEWFVEWMNVRAQEFSLFLTLVKRWEYSHGKNSSISRARLISPWWTNLSEHNSSRLRERISWISAKGNDIQESWLSVINDQL